MKRKNLLKIICLMLLIICSSFKVSYADFNKENNIYIEKSYDEENNCVIVNIISDMELMDTKPTWKLSSDRKSYTKVFYENQKYFTTVQNISGEIYEVEIVIDEVQKIEIEKQEIYDEDKNEVTIQLISNIELKDTKPTWKLSEDKKMYTKTFTSNTKYSTAIEDKWGNIINTEVEVTKIKSLEIRIDYEIIKETNQVRATIISNIKMKDTKPTWELSEDKKRYTKIYNENSKYVTKVESINGESKDIEVEIKDVDDKGPEIILDYVYNIDNTVTVYMKSNEEMKDTKPSWKLSDDKKVYERTFDTDVERYKTKVEDIYGNITNVRVAVKKKYQDLKIGNSNLKIAYMYTVYNEEIVQIISEREFEDTKPTWKLSEDKKIYTKVYNVNTQYSTSIQFFDGEKLDVNIDVSEIDNKGPEITLEYKYNSDDTVTIYMKSNEEMKDTKPTWKLSEDEKTYEKTYAANEQGYITKVQDIYGNNSDVKIVLNKSCQDFWCGNVKVKVGYMYTTYNEVVVQIISDKELENTKPTWKLSEDKKRYTKIYTQYEDYTTAIQFVDGGRYDIRISIDYFFKIIYEKGIYGKSGAVVQGKSGGSNLEYFRYGSGENVMFLTFCVHGYEDSWDRDGGVLVETANNLYQKLIEENDKSIAKKWTVYIFPEVNPDGRRLGDSNYGPGRRTLYSKIGKGIDINRSWQTGSYYKTYTDNRNYNGTAGFQAYEAEYLRDFLISHKSRNAKTILVDLHGWENQLIGDSQVCQYYKTQYPSCRTTGYGRYGTQYLITWGKAILGADVALVELPFANNYQEFINMNLSGKYVNATLEMLRDEAKIYSTYQANTEKEQKILNVTPKTEYEIAFSGMVKGSQPEFSEIDSIVEKFHPNRNGIWIKEEDREKILKYLNNNELLKSKYQIDEDGFVKVEEENSKTDIDKKIQNMINGDKQYLFCISSTCYNIDSITGEIVDNPYNELEKYQTYEYFKDNDKMIVFITENQNNVMTENEIFRSIIDLIDLQV